MRRHLIVLAVAGLFGALAASDAQACHKKKCPAPCPPPAPCVVVQPCPPPCPPPVCEPCPPPKKCHFKFKMPKLNLCHKKPACPPPPCPVAYEAAPVYAAPQASGQAHASGQ